MPYVHVCGMVYIADAALSPAERKLLEPHTADLGDPLPMPLALPDIGQEGKPLSVRRVALDACRRLFRLERALQLIEEAGLQELTDGAESLTPETKRRLLVAATQRTQEGDPLVNEAKPVPGNPAVKFTARRLDPNRVRFNVYVADTGAWRGEFDVHLARVVGLSLPHTGEVLTQKPRVEVIRWWETKAEYPFPLDEWDVDSLVFFAHNAPEAPK